MDRGRLQIALLVLAGLWGHTAQAQTLAVHLSEARTALEKKEKRAARGKLKDAEKAILGAGDVVPSVHLAQYWYLVGMEHHLRRRSDRAMNAWRNALVVNVRFEWDVDLMEDRDPRRLFEALRGETRDRKEVDCQVPEKVGAATTWADGRRVRHADVVSIGQHLVQVVCPDQTVHGQWLELPEEKFDWLEMCPEGVDTSVVVVDEEGTDDDLDDLAPEFDDMPSEEVSAKEVAAEEAAARAEAAKEARAKRAADRSAKKAAAREARAKRAADRAAKRAAERQARAKRAAERKAKREAAKEAPAKEAAAEEASVKETPSEDAPSEEAQAEDASAEEAPAEEAPAEEAPAKAPSTPSFLGRIAPKTYAVSAGAALVVGGIVTNYAVVDPVWVQIEDARDNPESYTRSQAQWLTDRFNTYRALTLGLMGGGVVVAGAGYYFLESPVQPVIHPGGAGLTGRW